MRKAKENGSYVRPWKFFHACLHSCLCAVFVCSSASSLSYFFPKERESEHEIEMSQILDKRRATD